MQSVVGGLPAWLVSGLVLGAVGSIVVAVLFLVADRVFPADQPSRRPSESGETKRRTELREYLTAIDEPFAENHFVEGQHVAFYLPKRDVAITFDARAYYRIDRSQTVPVLVEHEMPGMQLGARLPFEAPEVSLGPEPTQAVHPRVVAFRELGLSETATLEEVKSAYRRRVKEVHPDHGGTEADFRRVREAYTTAKQHAITQQAA